MRKILLIVTTIIIASVVAFFGHYALTRGLTVKIDNQTTSELSNFYITYNNDTLKEDTQIPTVSPGKTFSFKLNPDKKAKKAELWYKDSKGELHSETIVGYFEPSYSGNIEVMIKAVDENGKLNMEVNEDLSVF